MTDANAVTTAFFQGRTAMMILSTGSLSFVRENMKTPYQVAFLPRAAGQRRADRRRQPDHAEGQLAGAPGGGLDVDQVADQPGDRRRLEPLHRLFRAAHRRLRPAGDEGVPGRAPGCQGGAGSVAYARGWFATYNTVAVRKALEDGVQAVLSGKTTPEAAMATAQKQADALMKPYVDQTALKLPE